MTVTRRQQGLPLMQRMASQGWLAASVNYRLAPACRFPDPIVDIKRAIAWCDGDTALHTVRTRDSS
jgi:acetyl esterase/lipase